MKQHIPEHLKAFRTMQEYVSWPDFAALAILLVVLAIAGIL